MNNIYKIEEKIKLNEALQIKLNKFEEMKLSDYIDDADSVEIEKEIQILKNQLNLKVEKKYRILIIFLIILI
ncbi:MAG TPA: hypothetical protein EYG89_04095 [Bacteroidia bacterium]|nr:hypothetical protein [Sulfurimonas autotrophica]HIP33901.1 hypothetical protein [Bacteroidia bacterium]